MSDSEVLTSSKFASDDSDFVRCSPIAIFADKKICRQLSRKPAVIFAFECVPILFYKNKSVRHHIHKNQCWFHLLIIKVQKSVHISCQQIALYYFVVITPSFLHIMFEIIFSKFTSRNFILAFQIIVHQKSIFAVVRSFMLLDIIIHIQRIDSTLIRDQRTVRSDQGSPSVNGEALKIGILTEK